MKASWRRPVLAASACGALSLGRATVPPELPQETPSAVAASTGQPTSGERWLAATRTALGAATVVEVPFAQRAVASAEAVPVVFAFEAFAGQTLELTLTLTREPLGREAGIYVEVFRVIDVLGQALHQRLSALRPSFTSLSTRLPSDGTYHVLVQSGVSGTGGYRLTLELGGALPFPVVGAHADSVRGLFGASRDAGKRHHEGVDIFVQRLTPVLAVAAGSVMPRQDDLGGKAVWLNTPGTSYYYAHLDRVAVREQQQVQVGDVLGYVGNTGNAKAMPSHLHFGVYRWGREPIDPLPLLVGQRFDTRKPPPAAEAGG